jgi:7,8-dihydropterin-6-yl-methyl-4-(beta-D-ribofuranosyl)aminobenzene 5'-phosphate synthase
MPPALSRAATQGRPYGDRSIFDATVGAGRREDSAMHLTERFGQARSVVVTVLVDNRTDMLVESTAAVKRFVDKPLLAEHGLAVLIDLDDGAARILWDAGVTPIALLENMRRMEIDPATIQRIALSHGHDDHTTALTEVLQAMRLRPEFRKWEKDTPVVEMRHWAEGRRVPVVAHPAAFRERWARDPEGIWYGPMLPPPRAEWEAAGAEIVLAEGPYELAPGCWTTGPVPRRSFEHAGIPARLFYRQGDELLPDRIEEDQALVVNIQDKGLIVVAGCAHAGIVNTVEYAREISGVERVWAILGGFHLGRTNEEEVGRTVEALLALRPAVVAPSHCTGFAAIQRFAAAMPGSFVQGLVGTTYLFYTQGL